MAPKTKKMLLVDKYKPKSLKEVCGNKTIINKLNNWLKNFNTHKMKGFFLWGKPGIGKTTIAHLVCKENNFDIIEFNASDIRSKKLLKRELFLTYEDCKRIR